MNTLGIEDLINNFLYKVLFGPTPSNLCKLFANVWKAREKLPELKNFILTRPSSETEVKHALFSMKPNHAPGSDSIPTEFFKYCWEVINVDIMRLFTCFDEGSLIYTT